MELRMVLRRRSTWLGAVAVTALVGAGTVVAVVDGDRSEPASTAAPSASSPEARSSGTPGPLTGKALAAMPPADRGTAVDAEAALPGATAAGGAAQVVPPGGPRVVRSASLRVKVDEGGFGGAFERAKALAAAHGGFVASSSSSSGTAVAGAAATAEEDRKQRPQAGELTLRVPADRFDTVRRGLAELGMVENESLQGEDVSAQLVDYEARLKSLTAEEDALRTLMARATAVGEVLSVQGRLFEVRQQVEQLQAQRDHLDRAATLATVSVSLFEPGAATGPLPEPVSGLARSVRQAVRGSVAVVGGMIVVVGWLAPVALLGLAGWGVARLRRRAATVAAPEAVS